MRSAARAFYLAFYAFLGGLASGADVKYPQDTCAFDPNSVVSDACLSYGTIDALNNRIYPIVQSITQETDFFSYYRLNLFNKECPFWSDENGMCGNVACAVHTIDNEEDIPLTWRDVEELSKLEGPKAGHPGRKQQEERPKDKPLQGMLGEDVGETCVVENDEECDERDYCVPEDEGDYVSLVDNRERYTGYSGVGARQVWDAIYRENCFLKPLQSSAAPAANSPLLAGNNAPPRNSQEFALDNGCLEKRVFHRLVSGMHSSITTHLCWEYLNKTTGEWQPNPECFKERLYSHPEWVSNMYFNYALVSRAVAKLQKHLQHYAFCSSDPEQDGITRSRVCKLTDILSRQPQIFDEHLMFQEPGSRSLKEDFRNRFRNVSRIMDCVGCDKCRLWGKLQTQGYGTALKVLFEYDENKNGENPPLRRTELVALMNTFGRISHSVSAAQSFRRMIESGSDVDPNATSKEQEEGKDVQDGGRQLYKDGANRIYFKNDDEDFQYAPGEEPWSQPDLPDGASTWDEIKAECKLVFHVFIFVLKSWINIPRTL